jgi:Fe(3+) dicitrate transport protein
MFVCLLVLGQAQEVFLKGLAFTAMGDSLVDLTVTCRGQVVKGTASGYFNLQLSSGLHNVELVAKGLQKVNLELNLQRDTFIQVLMSPFGQTLDEVTVESGKDNSFGIARLNNIEGTAIYAGKKTEAVYLQDLSTNLSANNGRQMFAKVPGMNVFENDGSGTNVGIGGRGLNPNRISSFNTRQNGYDISADALGYPESYYTPPAEAIRRIEILRGAAGLQYGTQFGGMINYKFVEPEEKKKISGKFAQTIGAFGFYTSYNQLGGRFGKCMWMVAYQYKHYMGWRNHSASNAHNGFALLQYQPNQHFKIRAEYSYMRLLAEQPGGLTDKQFLDNPFQVTRPRNWFFVQWNLAALQTEYQISETMRFSAQVFKLIARRDALGYLGRPDRMDDSSQNRNLLSDVYNNIGAEARVLKRYVYKEHYCHLLIGTRVYNGHTNRRQGDASKGSEADFRFINPNNLENSAYTFPSLNLAVFSENTWQLSKRLNITPGIRAEYIQTASDGYYRLINRNLAGGVLLDKKIEDQQESQRKFLIGGIGMQYKFTNQIEIYANGSQNYRSVNFNDMRVVNPSFQVDPKLHDERGFTVDAGLRSTIKDLLYLDASVFYIGYNQRIGTTLKEDTVTLQIVRYRTNVGNSRNFGFEFFSELDWMKLKNRTNSHKLSSFVNVALIDARYTGNTVLSGNKVEYVPDIMLRTGITYGHKKFAATIQMAYTSAQYSDATNAVYAASGIYGEIPAYTVIDLSALYKYKQWECGTGINNLLNNRYFTRRAEGYPGPGIIPADPFNFYMSIRYRL